MTAIEEAAKRLRFLGTPLFRGLSDRPWPVVPWEGRMVRLGEELRLEGASVWYTVVGRRGKGVQTATLFIIHISGEALPLGPQARHGLPYAWRWLKAGGARLRTGPKGPWRLWDVGEPGLPL
jgi:hypothetical protein